MLKKIDPSILGSAKRNVSPFTIQLFFQIIVVAVCLLNIPVARQIFGFIFLTFLPGFIILCLFDLHKNGVLEVVLFSLGLSIAFIMISGLLINAIGLFIGISEPLSLLPLLIWSNCFVAVGGFIASTKGKLVFPSISLNLEKRTLLPIAAFGLLPILSIVGTYFVNSYENNAVLLILIAAIGLVFGLSVLYKKFLPEKMYPFALLMIAIAILLQTSLISSYVWGGDIHNERFVLETTLLNRYWNPEVLLADVLGRLYSMLSITVLPTFFSVTLDLAPDLFLKVACPIIFSFVPLALFYLWKKNIGSEKAFLAAFFFMSINIFYGELLSSTRQIFAELFFVLLLILITSKNISPKNELLLFSFFSFGLIVSHYALAELFLFFICIAFIAIKLLRRQVKGITINKIILFSTFMFLWYIYTSGSATFQTITDFGNYVLGQLGNFFDPSSRGTSVLIGLGLEQSPSIWNTISRIFAYLTEILIIVGFLALAFKRSKFSFERVFLMMSFVSVFFLFALVGVPGLASTFNMSRFYQILLIFLAPLCIIGGDFIVRFLFKKKSDRFGVIVLVAILVPYFFFQTGLVYEVAGNESWSVPLSKTRMDSLKLFRNYAYVNTGQVSAATWLNLNVPIQQIVVHSDVSGAFELRSYGLLQYFTYLTNTTSTAPNGIVYLSHLNVVDGIVVSDNYNFNASQLSYTKDMTTIYSNGNCQILSNQ